MIHQADSWAFQLFFHFKPLSLLQEGWDSPAEVAQIYLVVSYTTFIFIVAKKTFLTNSLC